MWYPISITLSHFLSYGQEETFTFDNNTTAIVVGQNEDDQGQKSNGSGKSGLLDAIAFALTGTYVRDCNNEELIHELHDTASVEMILANSVTEQALMIRRELTRGKSASVYINDEPVSANEAANTIERQLNISRKDLFDCFLVSKSKYTPFFSTTESAKRELIMRFSKADVIDVLFEEISQRKKDIEKDLAQLRIQKSHIQGCIDENKQIIARNENQDDKKDEISQKIDKYTQEIQQLSEQLQDTVNRLKIGNTTIDQYSKERDELQSSVDKVSEKVEELRTYQHSCSQELVKINASISQLQSSLKTTATCPSCNHKFSLSTDKPLDQLTEQLEQSLLLKRDAQQEADWAKKSVQKVQDKHKSSKDRYNVIADKIKRAHQRMRQLSEQQTSLTQRREKLNNTIHQLQQAQSSDKAFDVAPYEARIAELTGNLDDIVNKEDRKQDVLGKYQAYEILFKKFQAYLVRKSLKVFETFTNRYLQQLDTDLRITLDGYSQTKSGKTREKISVKVLRSGVEKGKHSKFSEGERVRMNICALLARQQLINMSCENNGGLNLLFMDEVINSLDELGVTVLLKSLQNLERTICVVTHASTQDIFNNIVTVKKHNNYSTIQ